MQTLQNRLGELDDRTTTTVVIGRFGLEVSATTPLGAPRRAAA